MGLTAELRIALQAEGLILIDDIGEFEDDKWTTVTANLRNQASMPDPAKAGRYIRPPSFTLGAKCMNRLKVSAALVRSSQGIGCVGPILRSRSDQSPIDSGEYALHSWKILYPPVEGNPRYEEGVRWCCPEANAQHSVPQVDFCSVRIFGNRHRRPWYPSYLRFAYRHTGRPCHAPSNRHAFFGNSWLDQSRIDCSCVSRPPDIRR